METNHKVIIESSINMEAVSSESIDLMVTLPPYPMIEMWDEMFAQQSSSVNKAL
jgi:DNA modification methylase